MRLITIFALAFVARSAMAQFITTLSVEDVSYAADNQVERGADKKIERGAVMVSVTEVVVSVTFGKAVDMSMIAAKVELRTINEFGGLIANLDVDPASVEAQVVTVAHKYPNRVDSQNFTLTFPVDATARVDTVKNDIPYKSALRVAEVPAIAIGDTETSAVADITIYYVDPVPNTDPRPVRIAFADNFLVPATGFDRASFDIIVTLSEQPRENLFTASHLTVVNGTADSGFYLGAIAPIDGADADGTADAATGRDGMHHWYLFRITPAAVVGNLVIKLNNFEDQEKPVSNRYIAPFRDIDRVEGLDKLTIKINKAVPARAEELVGIKVSVPAGIVIPGRGYLVAARNDGDGDADTHALRTDSTQIIYPGDPTEENLDLTDRKPYKLKYNLIKADNLPNLEAFLANGGVIDVVSPHALVITEVMWGTDTSLGTPSHNQWIELYNAGDAYKTTADTTYLVFYSANEILRPLNRDGTLPYGVTDRIGTVDAQNNYWSIVGKGQSGRTGQGETVTAAVAVVPRLDVISMYRVADATSGTYADGTKESSWRQSEPPSANFNLLSVGVRIGTPGADRIITPSEAKRIADAAAAKARAAAAKAAADTPVSVPKGGQVYISEVMFAGGGSLPQWIEISNGSRTERVDLSGWTLKVENATADADVSVGAKAVFTIPEGTKIDPSGQHATPSTILVVTELGRHNLDAGRGRMGKDQIISLWAEQRSALIDVGVTKFRYSLLSDMAFQIMLAPPAALITTPAADATDVVGNLGTDGTAAWELPMNESGARSSILRGHFRGARGPAAPRDGTLMDSWVLASDTGFAQVTHIRASSYYGAANDVGTPGFRAGSALPVELSQFRPVRDKETGAVVITWSTQSELNNAGFYIKRSQQAKGQFEIINATLIPGAGTTSEKQSYTYEDTTAQPNVVYYYQIEDVSLDGHRQTLTRGIRLRGDVGAAGKATVRWGDLKTSQ